MASFFQPTSLVSSFVLWLIGERLLVLLVLAKQCVKTPGADKSFLMLTPQHDEISIGVCVILCEQPSKRSFPPKISVQINAFDESNGDGVSRVSTHVYLLVFLGDRNAI